MLFDNDFCDTRFRLETGTPKSTFTLSTMSIWHLNLAVVSALEVQRIRCLAYSMCRNLKPSPTRIEIDPIVCADLGVTLHWGTQRKNGAWGYGGVGVGWFLKPPLQTSMRMVCVMLNKVVCNQSKKHAA